MAAADDRLVHHVVVVESREMGQLDRHCRRDDLRRPRLTEMRSEQHYRRAEPLAARVDQMPRRVGEHVAYSRGHLPQFLLDLAETGPHLGGERAVTKVHGDKCDHAGS